MHPPRSSPQLSNCAFRYLTVRKHRHAEGETPNLQSNTSMRSAQIPSQVSPDLVQRPRAPNGLLAGYTYIPRACTT